MILSEVLQYIMKADVMEINDLMLSVLNRYRELFPGDEIIFLSLPYDEKNREVELERIIEMRKRYRGLRGCGARSE